MTRKPHVLSVVSLFITILSVLAALTCPPQLTAGGQSSSTPLFLPAVTYETGGSQAAMVAVADVNGDGKPDLVVVNCGNCYGPPSITGGASVGVMLGSGDGTFKKAVTYGAGTASPRFVVVADVNGDGKLDLIVASRCIDNGCLVGAVVGILLGNGDGTFQPAVTYNSGGLFTGSVAVADVNGDGKPDLVVANNCSDPNCDGSVGVLLGNGDGTFQPVVTYPTGGLEAFAVAVADVNADRKPDVLVITDTPVCVLRVCSFPSAVGVLLGNGDGTFQPSVTYSSGGHSVPPLSSLLAVADVNGDGKPDVIVENSQCCRSADGVVGVLLGNGDGTFSPVVTYQSTGGGWGTSVAVADVNGDGKLDIVTTDQDAGNNGLNKGLVSLRLGNGDGTFQAEQTYSSGGFLTNSVAVADVNGDGKPDLVAANICADNTSACALTSVGVLLNNMSFCTTPPVITLSTSATSLWPPNGKMVPLTVSGAISDTGCILKTAAYAVTDEYGEVQPRGPVTIGVGGAYSFTVLLQSSRLGTDLDGRLYTITVSASNNAGETRSRTGSVIVPHDQRH